MESSKEGDCDLDPETQQKSNGEISNFRAADKALKRKRAAHVDALGPLD